MKGEKMSERSDKQKSKDKDGEKMKSGAERKSKPCTTPYPGYSYSSQYPASRSALKNQFLSTGNFGIAANSSSTTNK
ncbi:hypothetical protein Csa_016955 [Cucumis sativus]|nr:hypothetical protein Csa_016955 [Cucumis sativus]